MSALRVTLVAVRYYVATLVRSRCVLLLLVGLLLMVLGVYVYILNLFVGSMLIISFLLFSLAVCLFVSIVASE